MTEITFPEKVMNRTPERELALSKVRYAHQQMRGDEFSTDDRKVLFGAILREEVDTDEDATNLIEQFFNIV